MLVHSLAPAHSWQSIFSNFSKKSHTQGRPCAVVSTKDLVERAGFFSLIKTTQHFKSTIYITVLYPLHCYNFHNFYNSFYLRKHSYFSHSPRFLSSHCCFSINVFPQPLCTLPNNSSHSVMKNNLTHSTFIHKHNFRTIIIF